VIHSLEKEAVKIHEVAGHMDRRYLSGSAREKLVSPGEATNQQRTCQWAVPIADQVSFGRDGIAGFDQI
jgi:hypothetical protein